MLKIRPRSDDAHRMRERDADRDQRERCLQIIVNAINDDGGLRDFRNDHTFRAAEEAWEARDKALADHALRVCDREEIAAAQRVREEDLLKVEDAHGGVADVQTDEVQAIEEAFDRAVKSAEEKAMDPLIKATNAILAAAK